MSFFETLKNLKKGIKKLLGSFVMPYELEKEIDGILADSLDKNITGKNRNKILNNIVKQESIKEIRKKLSKILVKEKKSNKVTDKDLKDVLIERAKNLIGQASKGDDINSVRDLIFYSYLANSKITKFSENQLESIFKSDENDSLDFVDSNLKSEMGTSVLSILKILKNENLVKKRYLFSLIIKYFNYCRSINKTDKFPTIFGILNKYFNEYFSIFKKYLEKNKKGHEDLKNAIETIKPSNDFEVIDKKDYETKEISEVLTIPDECRHKIDSIIMEFKKKSDKIDENRDKTLTEMVNNKDLKKIKTYWNKILKKEKKEDKVTHEDLKNALIERAKELVEAFNKDYIRSFYTKSFSVTDIAFCAYLSGLKIEFPDNYISSIFEREEKNESVEFSYTIVTLDYLNKKKLIKKENFTYVLKKYAMYLNDQAKKSSTKKARFVHFLDMVRKNYSEEFSKLGEIVKEIENIDVSDILIIPDECEHEIDNFIMKFEYKKGYIDVNIEKTLDKMINEEDVEKIKTHWNKILIKEKKDEKVTDEHLQTAFVERAKVLVEAFNKDYIRSIYKKSFSLKDIAFCAYLSDSKVEFSDSYIPIFLAEEEKYENKYFGFADKSKNESASYTIIRLDYLKTRKLIEEETFSRIIKEYMTLLSEKAKKNKEKKEKFFNNLDILKKYYKKEFQELKGMIEKNKDGPNEFMIYQIDHAISKFKDDDNWLADGKKELLDKSKNEILDEILKDKKNDADYEKLKDALPKRAKDLIEAYNKGNIKNVFPSFLYIGFVQLAVCAYLADLKVKFSKDWISHIFKEEASDFLGSYSYKCPSKKESGALTIVILDIFKTKKLIEEDHFIDVLKQYINSFAQSVNREKGEFPYKAWFIDTICTLKRHYPNEFPKLKKDIEKYEFLKECLRENKQK